MKFDPSLYNDDFFKWHYDNVHEDCVKVGRELVKELKIKSLIDFGCGIGSYLEGAYGKCDILGTELSKSAKKYTSKKIIKHIHYGGDPARQIVISFPYQISLCIEVAEHIEPEGSEMLVFNITNFTKKYCIFTAAPPGQEGTGHINCQPYLYWIKLFKKYGFKKSDIKLKSFDHAPDYVRKNLMVFKNENSNN